MTLFAGLINLESLVPLAAFVAFAALAWWILELVATGKSRAAERLEELAQRSFHLRRLVAAAADEAHC